MQHTAIVDFLDSLLVEEGLENFVVVNHDVFIVGIEIDLQVQSCVWSMVRKKCRDLLHRKVVVVKDVH